MLHKYVWHKTIPFRRGSQQQREWRLLHVVTPMHPEDEAALQGKKRALDELANLKKTPYRLTLQEFYDHLFVRFKR